MGRSLLPLLLIALPFSAVADEPEFKPRVVLKQPIRPIVEPSTRKGSEMPESLLRDNELVLGVELDGEARAYPINMLTGPKREIINDRLGGQAIAATW